MKITNNLKIFVDGVEQENVLQIIINKSHIQIETLDNNSDSSCSYIKLKIIEDKKRVELISIDD